VPYFKCLAIIVNQYGSANNLLEKDLKGMKDENLNTVFAGPVKPKPSRKVQSASRREYVIKYNA